jgi:putative transposase
VIVGDITYLPLQNGKFCYLATFQDKFTRRVVGWQVSANMTAQLVINAFNRARSRGLIKRGAIIHTDRGSQYASVEYRRLLYIYGFRQSMSAKGNCYDNAQAESFFSRFKAELIEGGRFESVEQAGSEIFSYIEGYYNRIRRHSSLGYLSPLEFEKQLKIKNQRSRKSFVSCFY